MIVVPSSMTEGLYLMGFGMGSVFLFLTLLVIFTNLMSKIIHHFFVSTPQHIDVPVANVDSDKQEITAAIAISIHCHRKKQFAEKNKR